MSTGEQNKPQTAISDTKQNEAETKEQRNIEHKLEDEHLKVWLNEHQQYIVNHDGNKLLAEEQDIHWRYNMTLGDLIKYKVPSLKDSNSDADYWFSMTEEDKKVIRSKDPNRSDRRVFVEGKIKRLSDIDAIEQTFCAEFHLYLCWYLTKEEYLDYIQFQQDHNGNTEGWEPKEFPRFELPNCVEKNTFEYEEYPKQGKFRVVHLRGFGKNHLDLKDEFGDIGSNGIFCRTKLNVAGVFSEELELWDFPFDVQPLCIQLLSRSHGMKPIFLPCFRKKYFINMDPVYSVYPEWELVGICGDFGDADIASSRSKASYSKIELRMILKRKWPIYVFRSFMVIAVIDLLGLCAFVIYDTTDRLNMLLALLLTIVVAMQETLNEAYLTLLSKYSLCGFLYLVLLTAQATFYGYYEQETDTIFLYVFAAIFVVMQLYWCYMAADARKQGLEWAHFSADDLEKERGMSKIGYRLDYLSPYRYGDCERLLGFKCEPRLSEYLQEKDRINVAKNSVNTKYK